MKNFKRNKKEDVQESSKLITNLDPRSPYAELFRGIRTSIEYSSVDQALKSILITSSEPNSGKSITCANLAVVFAQQNKKNVTSGCRYAETYSEKNISEGFFKRIEWSFSQ